MKEKIDYNDLRSIIMQIVLLANITAVYIGKIRQIQFKKNEKRKE